MNDSEEFDVVCIGSSPLSIMEAVHQDRLGKKTLLIESSDRLGGAWSEFSLFGLKRVEIAPHFLRFDKVAYEFLKNTLHISIKPLSPQPKYLVDSSIFKVWIPFSATPWITLYSVLNSWLRNPKLQLNAETWRTSQARLTAAIQMLVQQWFSRSQPDVEYPLGGTIQLMDSLRAQLLASRVDVRLRQLLDRVRKKPDGKLLSQLGPTQISMKKLIMTDHQPICATLAGQPAHEPHFLQSEYVSLHLLVRTQKQVRTSFVQTKRKHVFSFLSDLTEYTPDVPAGMRLLVLRLNSAELPRNRLRAVELLQLLIQSGYLAVDTQLVDFEFSTYCQGTASEACLQRIESEYGSSVRVLRSACLVTSISQQVVRWRRDEQQFRTRFDDAHQTLLHPGTGAAQSVLS